MQPLISFFSLDAPEKVLPKRYHWLERLGTARVVLSRELCIYQRIPCKGVPRLRLGTFAQLQARSLSPFANTGSFALRQGGWLHLWLWNKDLEKQMPSQLPPNLRFSVWPSSLLGTNHDEGVRLLKAPQIPGVELQLWQQRILVDSLWFPAVPSPEEWAALYAQTPELQSSGWPEQLPESVFTSSISNKNKISFWGKNLTPRAESKPQVNWTSLMNGGFSLTTVVMLGWAAWVYGQLSSVKQLIDAGQQTQAAEAVAMEPVLQARQRTLRIQDWLQQASNLTSRPTIETILLELANTWPRQAIAFREMEILPPTVQATLVPSNVTGKSVKLTTLLEIIENSPYFYDARFVDAAGNGGFKFTWRIQDAASSTSGEN